MLHQGPMPHTYTHIHMCRGRHVVAMLIEGFHLTAAGWGMLGGRNKELNKLCPALPPSSTAWERVNVKAAALRLHAVLLCLFYFVSSINDEAPGGRERERDRGVMGGGGWHSGLPGGKVLAAGHCTLTHSHHRLTPRECAHSPQKYNEIAFQNGSGFLLVLLLWCPGGRRRVSHRSAA